MNIKTSTIYNKIKFWISKIPHIILGYIMAFAMMILVAANKYIVRNYIGNKIPPYITVTYRNFFALMFLLPILLRIFRQWRFSDNTYSEENVVIKCTNSTAMTTYSKFFLRLIRSFMNCSVLLLNYISYAKLPLGVAASIGASEPVMIALWSVIPRSGRKATKALFFYMILSCIGVLCIKLTQTSISSGKTIYSYSTGIPLLFLANVICSLTPYVTMKLKGNNTQAERESNVAYTTIFNFLIMLTVSMIFNASKLIESLIFMFSDMKCLLQLIFTGFVGFLLSQINFIIFNYIHPNVYAVISNMSIPLFIFLGSYENEKLTREIMIGASLIFISVILVSLHRNTVKDAIESDRALTQEEESKISLQTKFGMFAVAFSMLLFMMI